MKKWAEREVEIACKRENPNWDGKSFDYGCSCYQSALKAYNSLCEDGHSGMSWSITANILNRLMQNLPLTPISENDFKDVKPEYGKIQFCPRMSSLTRETDEEGNVKYSNSERVIFIDENNNTWHSQTATQIVDEMFPIILPYYPTRQKYRVFGYDFVVDENNKVRYERGTFNFHYFSYLLTPDGEKIKVDRLFIEDEGEIFGERKEIIKKNSKSALSYSRRLHNKEK